MEQSKHTEKNNLNATPDEKDISKVIHDLQSATAKKDAAGVLDCFADANVMYTLAPPLKVSSSSKAEGKEDLQKWFATWKENIKYYSRDLAVEYSGTVAYAHCLTYMGGEKLDGEKVDLWFRETFGLKKQDREWKITLQHQSVPMLMDGSQKAALNLKPESH